MSRSEDPGVKRGPIWSSHGWSFWTSVNLSFWHWNIGLMSGPTEEFFIPLFSTKANLFLDFQSMWIDLEHTSCFCQSGGGWLHCYGKLVAPQTLSKSTMDSACCLMTREVLVLFALVEPDFCAFLILFFLAGNRRRGFHSEHSWGNAQQDVWKPRSNKVSQQGDEEIQAKVLILKKKGRTCKEIFFWRSSGIWLWWMCFIVLYLQIDIITYIHTIH